MGGGGAAAWGAGAGAAGLAAAEGGGRTESRLTSDTSLSSLSSLSSSTIRLVKGEKRCGGRGKDFKSISLA